MQKDFQRKRYKENPKIKIEYQKKVPSKCYNWLKISKNRNTKKTKKNCHKVDGFLLLVKQGPYYVRAICHRSLYQCSVRLCKHQKYDILTPKLYHPVKSFDEKLYICETCHKHLNKNEIPCQVVCNKMAVHLIPNELKDYKEIRQSFNFRKNFV